MSIFFNLALLIQLVTNENAISAKFKMIIILKKKSCSTFKVKAFVVTHCTYFYVFDVTKLFHWYSIS